MSAAPVLRTLRPWMRARFGRDVYRIALDAGSSCPNRDGSKGRGGCIYCDIEGSGTGALRAGDELAAQLERGMQRILRRGAESGAIAYFQSYSNTYVETERLEQTLRTVEPWIDRGLVALSIATRPDTLPESALDVLARWNERVPVWIELGLEAADDAVLLAINRLHTVQEFEDACARVHARGLLLVVHAILGLPGDGREGARRTARCIARSGAQGVKVHQLMVLRRTALEAQWRQGKVELLEAQAYVEWVADFVELLAPEQVLHRLAADSPAGELVAPTWTLRKGEMRARVEAELARRGTQQGSAAQLV
jgi:radical SAM protein (TIGR01212 family)